MVNLNKLKIWCLYCIAVFIPKYFILWLGIGYGGYIKINAPGRLGNIFNPAIENEMESPQYNHNISNET